MAILHRKSNKAQNNDGDEASPVSIAGGKLDKLHERHTSTRIRFVMYALLVAIAVVFVLFDPESFLAFPKQGKLSSRLQHDSNVRVEKLPISESATLVAYFQRADNDKDSAENIALGEHDITVSFHESQCPEPTFGVRLSGAALVHVPLEEDHTSSTWTGRVTLPTPGMYNIEFALGGCHGQPLNEISKFIHNVALKAVGPSTITLHSNDIFPQAHWMANNAISPVEYAWIDPSRKETTELKAIDATVVKESVATKENGFFQFDKLSNYELLCFLGNKTMSEVRDQFLSLRPQISKGQRPFKFHMYEMSQNLQRPDQYWTTENKKRLRKCKHLLVNLEEFERPLSQKTYETEIVTFVGHLLNLMNDTTFPIRMFTWAESPLSPSACHDPFLTRTTNHPCNDVLKQLFDPKGPRFPSRVKLLDNTDITTPLMGEQRSKAMANIALRVFAIAGQQVAIWREAGQIGRIDGLHRNNVVEPNFDLLPYEGWA